MSIQLIQSISNIGVVKRLRLRALAVACVLLFCGVSQVEAALITVNTLLDSLAGASNCTLRDAIIAANDSQASGGCVAGEAGEDTISLPGGGLTIDSDLPFITDSVNIIGKGKSHTWVSGASLFAGTYRLLVFKGQSSSSQNTLLLKGLTLENGVGYQVSTFSPSTHGGCLYVDGNHTVTLDHVDVVTCHALNGGNGGGIYFGGIYLASNAEGSLNLLWSEISNNNQPTTSGTNLIGGGIAVSGPVNLSLINSRIVANSARSGGGIAVLSYDNGNPGTSDTQISLLRSQVLLNQTGASVNGTINRGGGIYIQAPHTNRSVHLDIQHSTINENMVRFSTSFGEGGGLYLEGGTNSLFVNIGNTKFHQNRDYDLTLASYINMDIYFSGTATVTTQGYNLLRSVSDVSSISPWRGGMKGTPNANDDFYLIPSDSFGDYLRDKGSCPNELYDYYGNGTLAGRALDLVNYSNQADGCDIGAQEYQGIPVSDYDADGVLDANDVFPIDANETLDADLDHTGDNSDNCPNDTNISQLDSDLDGIGDACDPTPLPNECDFFVIPVQNNNTLAFCL